MKPRTRIITILFLLIQLAGCASMLGGISQNMSFYSEPEGATVFVDGLLKGTTPITVKLRKDEYKKVILKMDGYRDQEILLNKRFDRTGWLNLVAISVISVSGFTVDAMNGATYEYTPNSFMIKLEKQHSNKVGKAHLDRQFEGELNDFVILHYTHLKQQCQTPCDNEQIQTLSWLLAREYQQDIKLARESALRILASTNDPLDYLTQLEVALGRPTTIRQVARISGKL